MKLKINKINLWLPANILKIKLFYKIIIKNIDTEIDIKQIHKMMKQVYQILKQYKKNNGPLVLVDITTKEKDIIKITL